MTYNSHHIILVLCEHSAVIKTDSAVEQYLFGPVGGTLTQEVSTVIDSKSS